MKKQLRLSTAAILATSAVVAVTVPAPTAEAATYKDVPKHANFHDALQELSQQGIITGYADGTFKPNASITRGQVAKILTRLLELQPSTKMQFSDVAKDHDFYQYASAVVAAGYMDKKNGKFNAKQTLTRNEYAEILMKAFNLQSKSVDLPFLDMNPQYRTAIQAVYANGLMSGTSKTRFNGSGEVKRSHIVLTIHKAMELKQEPGSEQPLAGAEKMSVTIADIDTTSITSTDDETIYTTPELQKLFRVSNEAALKDAELEVYVKNRKIVKVEKLTLYNDRAITRTIDGNKGSFAFPIVFNGSYFVAQNMNVAAIETGDEAIGSLTLQNVVVDEAVAVHDSLSNRFLLRLTDSEVPQLTVNRDNLTVEGTTKIDKIFVSEKAYDVTLNTGVGQLQFASDRYFTLRGTGSIDHIDVPLKSGVTLRNAGIIKTLQVEDRNADIYIEGDVYINNVTIPTNADYNSIFSYYASIQKYISKISYPNNATNLLYVEVDKPTKEEIAYNRALENVIKSHEHILDGTTLTIRTNFNEILPKMEDVSFRHNLYTVNHPSNSATIGISFPRSSTQGGIGYWNIDALNYGEIVEEYVPSAGEQKLGAYHTNDRVAYTIKFHTKRELTIRTTVEVDGVEKTLAESVINPGNNELMKNALASMLKGYTNTVNGNVLTESLQFNAIDDVIDEFRVLHVVKAHSEFPEGVTEVPLIIKKGETIVFNENVSVKDLQKGINTATLLSVPSEKMENFADNSVNEYTYELGTTEQIDVNTSLMVDGAIVKEGEIVTLNKQAAPVANFTSQRNNNATIPSIDRVPATVAMNNESNMRLTTQYNASTVQLH